MTPASGDGTVAAPTPTGFPFAYGRPIVNSILSIDASYMRIASWISFYASTVPALTMSSVRPGRSVPDLAGY